MVLSHAGGLSFFGGGKKYKPRQCAIALLPGLRTFVVSAFYPIVTIVAPNPYSRNEAS